MNFEKKDREKQCNCGESCCGETQKTIFDCGFAEEGNPIGDILEMLNLFGVGDLVKDKTLERFKIFEEITRTLREVIVENKDANDVQYNVERDISTGSTIIKIEVR